MAGNDSKYPAEVISLREGPELGRTGRPAVIGKPVPSDYPLIDNDPHFSRVVRYARASDYAAAAAATGFAPAAMWFMQKTSPAMVSKESLKSGNRVAFFVGLTAGFMIFYQRSIHRFYGFSENRREIELDMREMTDRVKRGEPLYGKTTTTEYMQGIANRNSKYTGIWLHVMPWFNFVNHPYHGVDTAKYYRQAELELEAERKGTK